MSKDHDALSKAQVDRIGVPKDEPSFLGHPMLDTLLESVVALGGELWVERDRRLTLEALLASKGIASSEDISAHALTDEQQAARDAALKVYVDRILGPLKKLNDGA